MRMRSPYIDPIILSNMIGARQADSTSHTIWFEGFRLGAVLQALSLRIRERLLEAYAQPTDHHKRNEFALKTGGCATRTTHFEPSHS